MYMLILGFILGVAVGMCATFFITGASAHDRENEIYQEGFNAGIRFNCDAEEEWKKNIMKRFERVD